MKNLTFVGLFVAASLFAGCVAPTANNSASNNANSAANSNAAPAAQNLTVVERPQKIVDLMASRGDQDNAKPVLKILEPKEGSTVNISTVVLKLQLSGDLKGYKPMMDPETHTGNHIHVILDNQPYEAYYNLDEAFELRNVADGEHTIRVFPSRPWHESYKNDGAFQMVRFTVKNGGADETRPATTNSGQQMSGANSNSNANTSATPEGKDMQPTTAGSVDPKKPLLTYSRPKGEYKNADADPVMIDFWLSSGKLKDDGGEYRVRYTVDGGSPKYIDKWAPIWLLGWTAGKHTVKLELVDQNGETVDNGGYNATSRDITITK
jgi:archaellum component FlaG (FlaF/FlaG flagellin family)